MSTQPDSLLSLQAVSGEVAGVLEEKHVVRVSPSACKLAKQQKGEKKKHKANNNKNNKPR